MTATLLLLPPPEPRTVDKDEAELARLCASLSAPGNKAQQAITLAKVRALYLAVHPDAEGGVHKAHGMNSSLGNNVADNLSPTFVKFVVDHTGLNKRKVYRLIEWGLKVRPELLEAVANTKAHGQGTLLATLAGLPADEQEAAFRARPAPPPPPENRLVDGFLKLYEKANERERAEGARVIANFLKEKHGGRRPC